MLVIVLQNASKECAFWTLKVNLQTKRGLKQLFRQIVEASQNTLQVIVTCDEKSLVCFSNDSFGHLFRPLPPSLHTIRNWKHIRSLYRCQKACGLHVLDHNDTDIIALGKFFSWSAMNDEEQPHGLSGESARMFVLRLVICPETNSPS